MSNSVTHFEIYGTDLPELGEFYKQLFGWTVEKAPGVDYYMIQTSAGETKGIRGGLTHRPIPEPRSWVHYVAVESIDEVLERLTSLGGRVMRGKSAVPKTAWYAIVEDPQGNIFAVWQPDPHAMPLPEADI